MYTLLIDNGHGSDTPGKRSPLLEDGRSRLFEWKFTRRVAQRIVELAPQYDIKPVILVPEDEDISLSTRATRANSYIRSNPGEKCVLISIHGNAFGKDSEVWMNARGWEAWTTVGKTNSDKLAECLYNAARKFFPSDTKFRTDKSEGDQDKEKDFTVLKKAACPAVLTENFFFNNIEDCRYMLSYMGIDAIARAHLAGTVYYFTM
ncbi:MAG: N-acetylmuramoyl-L-alanine amidase [Paludibacteraceae bacterium]|nr:N-acetylmuramoyl-L-alanine amidase [Paludibacteraceae bacterium]MBQ6777364.1 N-acetylmuramoyl-L-alanine amidase [Paludibacteraceae bacterium]